MIIRQPNFKDDRSNINKFKNKKDKFQPKKPKTKEELIKEFIRRKEGKSNG